MITVSDEFKKAIKRSERRIKGYVEILYDVPNIEVTTTPNYSSTYTSVVEVTDGRRVENDYASLDYLPLDGTRLSVLDSINTNAGYISDDIFEDILDPSMEFSFESTTIKGITMYFKDNYPIDMTLEFSDNTSIDIEPTSEIVQVTFEEPKTITGMTMTINDMEYKDRKIKLQEVDFGISYIYQNQDLLEFSIDEEVNKLAEEMPINETSITINNMNDIFNPLNPQGVVKYLTEGSKITPNIGVLTDTQGVEYVKMGEFYFDSYTNNSDKTTTLVGKNILKKLEAEPLKDTNEYNIFKSSMSKTDFQNLMANYDYTFNKLDYTSILAPYNLDKENLIDLIKEISFFNSTLFYANRNNELVLRFIDNTMQDSLSKSELLKDAKYKQIDRINTLVYNSPSSHTSTTVSSRTVFEGSFTLETSPQYILCKSTSPNLINATISQSGASSASIITKGYYLCFVKVIGTVGNTVNITLNSTQDVNESTTSAKKTVKTAGEKENTIEFTSKLKRNIGDINLLDYTPSYEISLEYNGDPSLEAGDYIKVETPYGYKNVFIQKNTFKFNGGLSGSIEGVE